MHNILFRLKSEIKFQKLPLDSTFINIGELRRMICDQLGLDRSKETLEMWDHGPSGTLFSDDNKMISTSQRVKVARVPLAVKPSTSNTAQGTVNGQQSADAASKTPLVPGDDDEFGGDVFDEQQQLKQMAEQRQQEWNREIALGGRKASKYRRLAEDAAPTQRPAGPPDGSAADTSHKKPYTAQARGIPASFLDRSSKPAVESSDDKGRVVKLQDGTVATLATGDLQRQEAAAEKAKQDAQALAQKKPMLAPLPTMAFDFAMDSMADPMETVRAQLLPKREDSPAATPPLADATPDSLPAPSTSNSLAVVVAPSKTSSPSPPPASVPAMAPQQLSPPTDYSFLSSCRSFLPYSDRVEDLVEVFAVVQPLSRSEWDDFTSNGTHGLHSRSLQQTSRTKTPADVYRRRTDSSRARHHGSEPSRRDRLRHDRHDEAERDRHDSDASPIKDRAGQARDLYSRHHDQARRQYTDRESAHLRDDRDESPQTRDLRDGAHDRHRSHAAPHGNRRNTRGDEYTRERARSEARDRPEDATNNVSRSPITDERWQDGDIHTNGAVASESPPRHSWGLANGADEVQSDGLPEGRMPNGLHHEDHQEQPSRKHTSGASYDDDELIPSGDAAPEKSSDKRAEGKSGKEKKRKHKDKHSKKESKEKHSKREHREKKRHRKAQDPGVAVPQDPE